MTRGSMDEMMHEGGRYLVIGYSLRPPAAFDALTPSELDVAVRWLDGASQREIARSRGAATRTVVNQIARIYRKLGVGSLNELLALVHR